MKSTLFSLLFTTEKASKFKPRSQIIQGGFSDTQVD